MKVWLNVYRLNTATLLLKLVGLPTWSRAFGFYKDQIKNHYYNLLFSSLVLVHFGKLDNFKQSSLHFIVRLHLHNETVS